MFTVRSVDATNQISDINFDNKDDAFDYYKSVSTNGLRNVSVLDREANIVISVKKVIGDTVYELKDGDLVRLRPKYRTKNESHTIFAVSDINENTERCSIMCVNSKMTVPSKETVGIEMIKVL